MSTSTIDRQIAALQCEIEADRKIASLPTMATEAMDADLPSVLLPELSMASEKLAQMMCQADFDSIVDDEIAELFQTLNEEAEYYSDAAEAFNEAWYDAHFQCVAEADQILKVLINQL